ncbi:MAG TPA: hypothetical protein VIH06_09880 [Ilumatobacteraceae bacterium]
MVAPASGLTRPDTVAWSVNAPPTATVGDAVVPMAGAATVTIAFSFVPLHAPVVGALLASPL